MNRIRNFIFFLIGLMTCMESLAGDSTAKNVNAESLTTGSVEILDPAALDLINKDTEITVISDGYKWTEGPLWVEDGGYLLFSDIPNNIVLKYQPGHNVVPYLKPSGATGLQAGDYNGGSNALLLNSKGELVLLQQGDRRVASMKAPLASPDANFTTLAGSFEGKRLNSPNDGVLHSNSSLYFTDPAYGLLDKLGDDRKELPFQGIYRLDSEGILTLLDDSVQHPNGIALSPDEKTLYIGVSDKEKPIWLAYSLTPDGLVSNKHIFYDASAYAGVDREPGLPDGMAVHSNGTLFATGPGGVWLFSPGAKVLAKIHTGKFTSNCALSSDQKHLYLTAHDTLMVVPLK